MVHTLTLRLRPYNYSPTKPAPASPPAAHLARSRRCTFRTPLRERLPPARDCAAPAQAAPGLPMAPLATSTSRGGARTRCNPHRHLCARKRKPARCNPHRHLCARRARARTHTHTHTHTAAKGGHGAGGDAALADAAGLSPAPSPSLPPSLTLYPPIHLPTFLYFCCLALGCSLSNTHSLTGPRGALRCRRLSRLCASTIAHPLAPSLQAPPVAVRWLAHGTRIPQSSPFF